MLVVFHSFPWKECSCHVLTPVVAANVPCEHLFYFSDICSSLCKWDEGVLKRGEKDIIVDSSDVGAGYFKFQLLL
jgi:hypothetical protein